MISSRDLGESSRKITLYTRELGLVHARAQGVRKLASKLRYGLVDHTLTQVSLVKGKSEWRIVGAVYSDLLKDISTRRDGRVLVAHVFSLLERLIHGESSNFELFDVLVRGFKFVSSERGSLYNAEIIFVLNILYHLGYLSKNDELGRFVEFSDWTAELVDAVASIRERAINAINRSFSETQL